MPFFPEPFKFEEIDATGVGSTTLVGSIRRTRGDGSNCFSVRTAQGEVRIVNMYTEAIEDAIAEGMVSWPIKISLLRPGIGVVTDARLEDCFFRKDFCTSCCPDDLLPLPQRLKINRSIAKGETIYRCNDKGEITSVIMKMNSSAAAAALDNVGFRFRVTEELGATIINEDALKRVSIDQGGGTTIVTDDSEV